MARLDFAKTLTKVAGAGAIATLMLACDSSSTVCKNGIQAEISGNHGHELVAPKTKGARYNLVGGTHEHGVVLGATDLAKLEDGASTTTRASSQNAHTHEITLKCK